MEDINKQNNLFKNLKGLNGCYLIGKIEGVDFTASGKLDNGTVYGSTIKLKFANQVSSVKSVNGIDISTTKYVSQTIKIPVSDNELISKVQEFNSQIGKEVVIELELSDNSSFKTNKVFPIL